MVFAAIRGAGFWAGPVLGYHGNSTPALLCLWAGAVKPQQNPRDRLPDWRWHRRRAFGHLFSLKAQRGTPNGNIQVFVGRAPCYRDFNPLSSARAQGSSPHTALGSVSVPLQLR